MFGLFLRRNFSTLKKMKEFKVKIASEENKKEIYELFKNDYLPDSLVYVGLNITTPLSLEEWPAVKFLKNGLILVAESKESDLMGYSVNVIPNDGKHPILHPQIKKFYDFVEKDSNGLLSTLKKSTMEVTSLCVKKKYRGLSLAEKLTEESEILAKNLGQNRVFGLPSSNWMESVVKRRGWSCLYRLYYKDYLKEDKNFKLPPAPNDSVTIYQKMF